VIDRVGQVWMARLGVETFPFVVLELQGSTWIVQNLTRVTESEQIGTVKSSQFGVEEGVFIEYERRLQNKGIQRGELLYLSGTASLLMERVT